MHKRRLDKLFTVNIIVKVVNTMFLENIAGKNVRFRAGHIDLSAKKGTYPTYGHQSIINLNF